MSRPCQACGHDVCCCEAVAAARVESADRQNGTLADRVRAYMAQSMAMTRPADDQEQNWIFGHMVTFAIKERRAQLREASAVSHVEAPANEAERTVRSIAAMLGWENVPPRETLEADIRALKARAKVTPA